MNIFAGHREQQWHDFQEGLNDADRREKIIENTIEVTENLYKSWKGEMQKYFSDDLFVDINKTMFDECRKEYLENPEHDTYLND